MLHPAFSSNVPERETFPLFTPGQVISTGSLRLDIALGTGGYPRSTLVEINGPPSSGKSCLCLHAVAEAQKMGGLCAYIDPDRSLCPAFGRSCGVRIEDLYFAEPSCTEQALDILETLARSQAFALIALDSLTSLVPSGELSGQDFSTFEERNPELLSNSLSRLSTCLKQSETVVILTRHTASGMSAVYHNLSANPQRLALKLHAGLSIRLKRLDHIVAGRQIIGSKIEARLTSGKFRPLLNTIDFDIIAQQGINKTAETLALGIFIREIQRQPEGFFYQNIHLGQTFSQALEFLQANERIREELERNIRRAFVPKRIIAAT